MTVLIVEPGKTPRTAEIDGSLESMQAVVGGYIQAVYPFDDEIALICNEEGKIMHLPFNRPLYLPETGVVYDIVAGTFFMCAAPSEDSSFGSLNEEQIGRCTRYLEGSGLDA